MDIHRDATDKDKAHAPLDYPRFPKRKEKKRKEKKRKEKKTVFRRYNVLDVRSQFVRQMHQTIIRLEKKQQIPVDG